MGEAKPVLSRFEAEFEAHRSRLQEIGFILPGSVVRRYTACTSPGCKCRGDPPQRHGPYYDWTRRVDGKNLAKRITPEQARVYQEWIRNRKEFKRIMARMTRAAEKAARRVG